MLDSFGGGAECTNSSAEASPAPPQPQFSLLETLLLEKGDYFLLERHLARIARSAAALGFPFHIEGARRLLQILAAGGRDGKVRLLAERDGSLYAGIQPLEAAGAEPVLAGFADESVHSGNTFLYHKTTCRDLYDRLRESHAEWGEVLLVNERGEVTEGTISTVVVRMEGALWTPPVSCGLLPGTFREELLARGEVRERVLTPDDLRRAEELYLVNSVRKWRRAVLAR